MAKNSMTIRTAIDVVSRLPAGQSVMFRGETGVGKSDVTRQIAKLIAKNYNLPDYPCVDKRLGQMSEGDVIGLPSTDGEVTRFNPPDWVIAACKAPCILFLDELNRATREVMQAAFQLVLDHELNGWKLHPLTRVFTAVNVGASYSVNEIDPALLNRFWVVDLTPDVEDWLSWAVEHELAPGQLSIDPCLIDFIKQNSQWLDPPKNAELDDIIATRRSWEHLNTALRSAKTRDGRRLMDVPTDPLFYAMSVGFVGPEAAGAFTSFVKSIDTQLTGEDIIERWDEHKDKFAKFSISRINDMIEKVAAYVTTFTTLNDVQGTNLQNFMNALGAEPRIACWTKMSAAGTTKLELIKCIHTYCVKSILGVFGVPHGVAGVNVPANIPSIFQKSGE